MATFFAKYHSRLLLIIAVFVIIYSTVQRINNNSAWESGGDFLTHLQAITEFSVGTNPYLRTVDTFSNLQNDPSAKGYAYLPGILYTNFVLNIIHSFVVVYITPNSSLPFLMKIPGLLANLAIGAFFIKTLYTEKKDPWAMLFSILIWFYNPIFYIKGSLEAYDAVPIALMLWSLYYLEKNTVITALLYGLSIIFKTFPVVLLVIFLLKTKDKLTFVLTGILVYLTFSFPFMLSLSEFLTYLQGSFLVHGDRFVQGRPFLYYVSWFYRIEFFRIIPFKVYTVLSMITGFIISFFVLEVRPMFNKYVLSAIAFVTFYLFTPVLNRTYLLWGLPIFLIGGYTFFSKKPALKPLFYITLTFWWAFCYWYLFQWRDGFHIWHPIY